MIDGTTTRDAPAGVRDAWSDAEAAEAVARWAPAVGEERALRVYTSRLIGRDSALVLEGGGNTSVKGLEARLVGPPMPAIYVKGSGWDLADIEPAGLPGLDLEYLRRLRALDDLGDEAMVNELRTHLFDAAAPTPSVETLMHAFLPHRYVDHSHADAIIALTNQREGERLVAEALGDRVAVLPYVMPGFLLARAVADLADAHPDAIGIVLLKHGLVTWGDTARESYARHVELVAAAERFAAERASRPAPAPRGGRVDPAAALPALRGAVAVGTGDPDDPWRRMVLDVRDAPDLLGLIEGPEGAELAASAPLTPDHTIRAKPWMLHVGDADAAADDWPARVREAVARYADRYTAYLDRGAARNPGVTRLDPMPRVVLVPGLGVVGAGETAKAAAAAADIAEHTLRVKDLGRRVGDYEGLSDDELFDMEYWSLEQAKLSKAARPPLAGRVALVTGAAGAIGLGVADELLRAGAHVALADLDGDRLDDAVGRLGEGHEARRVAAVRMDVADEGSVREGYAACIGAFGGVDVVVPSAGVAGVARIVDARLEDWDRMAAVNARGTFLTIREGARIMRAQGTGGSVVIVSSKNVFGPGAAFGAYSASKAAAHQIGRVAALELGADGIRVNMVNADAVFGDARTPSQLWEEIGPSRAASRGMDVAELRDFYRSRTLLGAEVTAAHIGRAVAFLAQGGIPTTGATLPVDGGVPEAAPR